MLSRRPGRRLLVRQILCRTRWLGRLAKFRLSSSNTLGRSSSAQQAARRDRELAGATDNLREKLDSEIRNGPRLPAPLKELFLSSYTNETPLSIYGQMLFNYNKQNGQN